jgi:hypothetical protein
MELRSRALGCFVALLLSGMCPRPGADDSDTITIPMKPSKASRPGHISVTLDKKGIPSITPAKDTQLAHQGIIKVDGATFNIYLPAADSYSLKNAGTGEGQFENTSTLLSIDADGDGKFAADEGWYADLPLRIGDRMFEVVRMAPDGSSLTLKRSNKQLAGVIVGRKVPPFSYRTADGRSFTENSYRGKAVLIDVWSVT